MAKEKSIKTEVMPIPVSIKEAIEFLGQMGLLQRQIKKINNAINNSIERFKVRATEKILPREEQISRLFEGLFIFAQSRRKELTEGGEKKNSSVANR